MGVNDEQKQLFVTFMHRYVIVSKQRSFYITIKKKHERS